MQIPKMGVDICIGDPEDANRLTSAQSEQQRAEGKASKEVSRPCHNPKYSVDVDDDGDSDEDSIHLKMKFNLAMRMCHQEHPKALQVKHTRNKRLVAFLTCLM